jgi:hypothetical protein
MRNARVSAERWRAVFREQHNSGLSVAAYCRQARVPLASFYAWRRRLRDGAVSARGPSMRRTNPKPSRNEDATFVEIKLPADVSAAWPETGPAGGIELYLPGRRCLVIRPGFDRPTLLDLLAILGGSTSRFVTGDANALSFATREAGA